jgi:cytochrome c
MSRFPETARRAAAALILAAGAAGHAGAEGFGLGREAAPEEVAAWDIDVRPDGQGLPEGSGDAWTGEEVFAQQCAHCHGDFGEGRDRWPVLAGGHDTLTRARPVKTIGSYWPFASTVYDYINRAMPFGYAQSLTPDQVYAITAYLLYMNDVITEDDFVVSDENLAEIELPNHGNFFMDPRPDIPLVSEEGEPCMSGCKESVEITMRARVLDVTPEADEETSAGITVD